MASGLTVIISANHSSFFFFSPTSVSAVTWHHLFHYFNNASSFYFARTCKLGKSMFIVKTSAAIWLVCEPKEPSLSAAGDKAIVFRKALWRISIPFVSDIILGRYLIIHLLSLAETDQWFKVVIKEKEMKMIETETAWSHNLFP